MAQIRTSIRTSHKKPPTTTALSVTCPAPITANSPDGNGVAVAFTPTSQGGTAPVVITSSPASGSTFPVGATVVQVTATDAAGKVATCSFTVSVTFGLGIPGSPIPSNGATGIPTTQVFSWSVVPGAANYDVYFGTVNPPPLVSSAQVGTSYNPGTTLNSQTHFWKVVARAVGGQTASGPIWSDTTVAAGGSTSRLQPSDFTALGAFGLPGSHNLDFPAGLTGRYVSAALRLYTTNYAGSGAGELIEFAPVADGSLSLTGPFTQASIARNFGDIYQTEIARLVDDGSGVPPPQFGIASGVIPAGFFWDPQDSRMYWMRSASYNNTVSTSDTCLGYSTLDDGAVSGLGKGMWKLSPISVYGNRWVFGILPIPSAFAATYCGGRRLGVGFGGNLSIISNGPFSAGPALFAMFPPIVGVDPNDDFITTTLKELLNYPAVANGVGEAAARAPRDTTLHCNQDFPDSFNGRSDVWAWADAFGGTCPGVWIDGVTKQGVVFLASLAGGSALSTILGSPAPTHSSFAVNNVGDTQAGDFIRWQTTLTQGQSHYPFCSGRVASVVGSLITLATIENGDPNLSVDPSDLPLVGGQFFTGQWYQGGGGANTRFYTPLYLYDPADLARVAQGLSPAQLTPYSMTNLALPGQTYPMAGGNQNFSPHPAAPAGAWFDPTTSRLYVLAKGCPNGGSLVYVYAVNA